jgi:uncharacterized protein YceK
MKKIFVLFFIATISFTGCKKVFKLILGQADNAAKQGDNIIKSSDDAVKGISKGDAMQKVGEAAADIAEDEEEK